MITKKSVIFLQSTIGIIYSIHKLNEGFQNTIYKIESQKGDYCLRISKRNSKKHVQYEVDILECLRNFPVIKLQRVGGEYIFSVEGKAAILYLYIDGDFKENNTLKELNIGGEFLGEFHNECTDIKCPRDHFEFYNLSDRMIQEYSTYIADVDIPHKELLPKIV